MSGTSLEPNGLSLASTKGAATWQELHRYIATGNRWEDEKFLRDFTSRVKLPGSVCRREWKTWLASHPPRWDDYFAWSVAAHNDVNARLGKPILTVEQARVIWSAPPCTPPPAALASL